MLLNLAASGGAVTPTYVDDVFSAQTFVTSAGTYSSKELALPFDISVDGDPDWAYVKRLIPLLGSNSYEAVSKTHLGGNLNGGAGLMGPFGITGVGSYVANSASDPYVDYSSNLAPPSGSNFNIPWCIEAWIGGATPIVPTATMFIHGDLSGNPDRIDFYAQGGSTPGGLRVLAYVYAANVAVASFSYVASYYDPHFVSLSFTGTQLLLYVDGVQRGVASFTGWVTPPTHSGRLGCAGGSNVDDGAQGWIAQFRSTFGSARTGTRTSVPTKKFPITGGANTVSGMVWIKSRTSADSHTLVDSISQNGLLSNNTGSYNNIGNVGVAFGGSNITLETSGGSANPTGSRNAIAWTFKKAPKFFDIVTYTGNGANRTIAHSLGQAPGMILIKRTNAPSQWTVYHRSLANTEYMVLDTTAAKVTGATTYWNSTTADASTFSLGTAADVNTNTATYVAYLFSHDTATDGLIQCGSIATNGAGDGSVTLGWEPQYVMIKNASAVQDWFVVDSARGMTVGYGGNRLNPNTSAADNTNSIVSPNATGFNVTNLAASNTYIYLAIRRPNKPPTLGTQVYNAIARSGTGAVATVTGAGFAPDLLMSRAQNLAYGNGLYDRLRGPLISLSTYSTNADVSYTESLTSFDMDGFTAGADASGWYVNRGGVSANYIHHFFKRAPGVFDEVCYTGTGVAKTESHSLGVAPELMIVKSRSAVNNWATYVASVGNTAAMYLDSTATPVTSGNFFNNTSPTTSVFTVGVAGSTNANAATFVAYLFATKVGISKVGSYTGNGSALTVNCGFTTGARFLLIKRTDSTGDWFVWDTARGIVAGNDPHLALNLTAAEVTTDDTIDPDTSGFIVNQVAATNVNVTSATYVFLAFS